MLLLSDIHFVRRLVLQLFLALCIYSETGEASNSIQTLGCSEWMVLTERRRWIAKSLFREHATGTSVDLAPHP
jgi:hypothetical protein